MPISDWHYSGRASSLNPIYQRHLLFAYLSGASNAVSARPLLQFEKGGGLAYRVS